MERDVMSKTATVSASARAVAHQDYLALIHEFPVRPLRSAREHAAARGVLDRLIGRDDLTVGQRDYLEALARFVEDYETQQRIGRFKTLGPVELLKHLMEENGMNTTDLGVVLGSRGLASEVLNGKRGLSKMLIAKLSQRFGLEPALFLDVRDD
jgi:HTH-type transcriptional regulator / antitoxin HigA